MKIEFHGVSKYYKGKAALKDFSATLEPGIYGLLGANGAGKTTLINIFVGILKSDGGRILVDGRDAKALGRDFLRQIGYLPQYPAFYSDFRIWDFLRYICALKEIPRAEGERRAGELLEAVNLSRDADKRIGALSGGMRQRVGIVQALLGGPGILILDEPTAGLDPQERIRFRNLITRFSAGRVVLLATHIVSDVDSIANEVLILKQGVLIRQDTPARLEESLRGKVWELTVSGDGELARFDAFRISNMHRDAEGLHLRILSEDKPSEEAVPASAGLEDVFLYHFGQPEAVPTKEAT